MRGRRMLVGTAAAGALAWTLLAAAGTWAQEPDGPGDVAWIQEDLDAAFQQAKTTGKPLLIVFR